MGRIFVKPNKGLVVRHPEKPTYILPTEGEEVTDSPIWRRFERDGDVKISEIEEPKEKSAGSEKNTQQGDK